MEPMEFMSKYAQHLNESQKKAVQAVDGPVLLLAVPGSGKTTVLVTRLGYNECTVMNVPCTFSKLLNDVIYS